MLSIEYAPTPLNVVRTYRIQYLLVLDSFLELIEIRVLQKSWVQYIIMHEYKLNCLIVDNRSCYSEVISGCHSLSFLSFSLLYCSF